MSNPILVGLDREREDDAPLAFGTATARLTGAPLTVLAAYLHDHHRYHHHRGNNSATGDREETEAHEYLQRQ